MKILGVITARGGSKGIPGKNIKPLLGKPLIAYTIEAAKKSGVLDRLILSTDDTQIAEVAKKYGCEVPLMRPKTEELAGDKATHLEVMRHAVSWLKEKENYYPDYTMILQPTSPLRQPFHIKEAVELILKTGADSAVSVSEVPDHFNCSNNMIINDKGLLKLINGSPIYKRVPRRQDRPKNYWSNGIIYLFKTDLLFNEANPNFYGENTVPCIIDQKYASDIDAPSDWDAAEEAMRRLNI